MSKETSSQTIAHLLNQEQEVMGSLDKPVELPNPYAPLPTPKKPTKYNPPFKKHYQMYGMTQ
jgi:hypothetical protein